MLSVMRNLGVLGLGLTRPNLELMSRAAEPAAGQGLLRRMALTQRVASPWEDRPLAQRSVAHLSASASHRVDDEAEKPAGKSPFEIRLQLKNGEAAVLRRVQSQDVKGLDALLARSQTFRGGDADEHLWAAASKDHDAFVAVVNGRIVGVGTLDRDTGEMEWQKDAAFLADHGLAPSSVCISSMTVDREMRSLGIGKAMKQAQAVGARQMGYEGVMSLTADETVKHIVSRLGGAVQQGGVFGWTLVKVAPDRKSE